MVLKTLKTITPIGRPGIMNPARKGDKTFKANQLAFCHGNIVYSAKILTKHDVGDRHDHTCRYLDAVSQGRVKYLVKLTMKMRAIIKETKNDHPKIQIRSQIQARKIASDTYKAY